MNRILKTTVIAAAVMSVAGVAQARDQIRIVGSSTVYPFASYVTEEFGALTNYPTPVIESTGSGGGIRLFCNGVGEGTPDITNASRRMKPSELERCEENGVTDVTEAKIGSDGIVLGLAATNEPIDLTLEQIFLAVAAQVPVDGELVDNPYTNWSDIDASLPDRAISIYGPPSTSGTRDAFEELVMEAASAEMDIYGEEGYTDIRTDGVYIDAGENDNLIVQRLAEDTGAFGIFGYSFLVENPDTIMGATIGGVEPEVEAISSGEYPVARSLWFYLKNQHADEVTPMYEYANMFMEDQMIGSDGYLVDIGLIPLPEAEREQARQKVADRVKLVAADLE
ncbi:MULTISPECIES: substrate-binding domain-containing protein [Halomonadaceae]|jgi:phosphate transport system substrate-binding protein|uniref:Phosphate ABC transporter substrate-binding protein n=1 Tax=Vreelandella aquamarina TaxID=77097 RepID=A0A0D7UVF5_9GAMM|nr:MULTISPECIES: substrate-binding domain-containing protein [Halomonas]MEC7295609.1 substrate-binding domain-containing protein [Pseudomonadota bacterium]KJD18605.1 phosphate-binding protein [Halomonas meridiana]MCC4286600.1 substrate-binding domain-containing protein [Halomonas meridiana]MCO7242735.1 substrate-binding domain-containing protein [Halomonas sp. Ps84H-12]MCP1304448.1 substrate-binding domain-containing protein [Halomonas sp. R1t8]|tara:strand:+ start:28 stop:1041 length:1014 start_codon:yes stop_codon:yes gene_type:complete